MGGDCMRKMTTRKPKDEFSDDCGKAVEYSPFKGIAAVGLGLAIISASTFLGKEAQGLIKDPANQNMAVQLFYAMRDTGMGIAGAGGLHGLGYIFRSLRRL